MHHRWSPEAYRCRVKGAGQDGDTALPPPQLPAVSGLVEDSAQVAWLPQPPWAGITAAVAAVHSNIAHATRSIRSPRRLYAELGRWSWGFMAMTFIVLLASCLGQSSGPSHRVAGGDKRSADLLSGDAQAAQDGDDGGLADHERDYTSAALLSRLIDQDKEDAAFLGQVKANLEQLCGALYKLRTECPLLTHIITRRSRVVSCTTQNASQQAWLEPAVIKAQLILAAGVAAFSHPTELVLKTSAGGVFTLKFNAHQVLVTQRRFISDSADKHEAKFVDIKEILLRRVDGQPFIDKEKNVWLSLTVDGQELMFADSEPERSESEGVDNMMMRQLNSRGAIQRYELVGQSLSVLAGWKQRRECQPNTKNLIAHALPPAGVP